MSSKSKQKSFIPAASQDLLSVQLVVYGADREERRKFFEAQEKLHPDFKDKISLIEVDKVEDAAFLKVTEDGLDNHWVAMIDAGAWKHKPDLADFSLKASQYAAAGVVAVHYTDATAPIYIAPANMWRYVFGAFKRGSLSQRIEFLCLRSQLDIVRKDINKPSPHQLSAQKAPKSLWWEWMVMLPLREFRHQPPQHYSFLGEWSWYRFKFLAFALALLIGMPIAAWQAGISGDEKVQYEQGKAILDWFVNFGEETEANKTALDDQRFLMHLYGSSFDTVTAAFNELFGVDNEYEWRHVLNALTGWLLILFTGLIAVHISGWRAGLLAMFLLFVSPRILGHSWNNPKDIPFAMTYMAALYAMILYFKNFDAPKRRHYIWLMIAIGASIGIRIGGLILIAYLFLFAGLYFLYTSGKISQWFAAANLRRIKPTIVFLAVVTAGSYVAGIVLWPYALQDPLTNPFESLDVMTSYSKHAGSIRQLFEGVITWSDRLPWYYISKYILMTTPVVIFIGAILYLGTFFKAQRKGQLFWKFMMLFAFVFPIAYIVAKESNVYGGWRHALFVYPPLVVGAALGFDYVIGRIRKHSIRIATFILVFVLALHPFIFTIKNHPYQYVYFNELYGGVKNAVGNYEVDYYYHSSKEAYEWLRENADWETFGENKKLKLATNGIYSINYFNRNDTHRIQALYDRWYDRGESDWDYFLVVNSYINPGQLKDGLWPPKNAVYVVEAGGAPLCAVVKRATYKDFEAFRAYKSGDVQEAILGYEEALSVDPQTETNYLHLADAYGQLRQYDKALVTLERLLKVYPEYDKAYYSKSVMLLQSGMLKEAVDAAKHTLKLNPKFDQAYYILGVIYANAGDNGEAIKQLNKCIEGAPNFGPAYQLLSQIYQQTGQTELAKRYGDAATQLQ
jgi:tetratricopeptide (TPR) repeat protein